MVIRGKEVHGIGAHQGPGGFVFVGYLCLLGIRKGDIKKFVPILVILGFYIRSGKKQHIDKALVKWSCGLKPFRPGLRISRFAIPAGNQCSDCDAENGKFEYSFHNQY